MEKGLRENLFGSKRGKLIAAVFLAIAGAAVVAEWSSGLLGHAAGGLRQAYYTSDDGASFFAEDSGKAAPFDKDGTTVVQAHVFKCGQTLKVGYLSRSTAAFQQALQAAATAKAGSQSQPPMSALGPAGIEVKAPGGAKWISKESKAGLTIFNFKCPDGSTAIEVYP